ncbi:hypothetical protein F4803DRAFT_398981 [Xylaria telfairii]|nr:hypothetical protein F4803DRAFT_398981 [Xylaria telfairii]
MNQAQPQAPPRRTANSIVFGVPVKECTSGHPRFMWSPGQVAIMEHWIQIHPPYSEVNFNNLLEALDLHGFRNLRNADGQLMSEMIRKKVLSKLSKLRTQLARNNPPPGPPPPPQPRNPNNNPGNGFIPGYSINIINPDGP